MSTVVYTIDGSNTADFTTLANLFREWTSDDGNDFDNASAPPALRIYRSGGAPVPVSTGGTPLRTWEDLGVPAGKFVTSVVLRFRAKQVAFVNMLESILTLSASFGGGADVRNLYYSTSFGSGLSGSWATVSGSTACIPEAYAASNTSFGFSLRLDNFGSGVYSYEYRFDTFELTITYGDTWVDDCSGGGSPNPAQTLTPTTATLHPGQTQVFTTNNPAYFGVTGNPGANTSGLSTRGGGTSGNSGSITPAGDSLSVTYTAPNFPGVYAVNALDQSNGDNNAVALVTVTPEAATAPRLVDMPALPAAFGAFLFTPGGLRRSLPNNRIKAAKWTDERYGGWTDFSLDLNALLTDSIAAAQGDRIEFWWQGERRYRGYVTSVTLSEEDPPVVTVSGYGIAFFAAKPTVSHAFVYPTPTDISRAFAEIASEFVSPLNPTLVIDAQPVGALIQQAESSYKSVGEVVNDLVQNQGENLAVWGGDADSDGNDRLFVRPFSTVVDHAIRIPGRNTTVGKRETQSADIVNRLTILGGNPRFPNLIYNSSFERPRFSGEGEGNLLGDPDFEAGGVWTGDGSTVTAGTAEGNAFTGSKMGQTEGSGKHLAQTQNPPAIPVVPGWDYRIYVVARAETATTTAAGRVTLTWKDSGGSTLSTTTLDLPAIGSGAAYPLSTYWQAFQGVSRAPSGATGFTFDIKTQSGGGSGAGIHWDACELSPATVLYQDRWELTTLGSSAINALNWAYRDGIDGGFCVFADMAASDSDANEAAIEPQALERFEVQGGSTYTASVFLKSPPGVTTNGKLRLEVQEFNASGAQTVITHINIAAGSGWPVWTQEYQNVTLDPTTTHALVRFVFRGDSAVLLDGLCFRDASAGTEYIRDGQFITQIDVRDTSLTGLSSAALSSVDTYGTRDGIEQVDSITTIEDARTYATAYFNVHAVAFPLPSLEVVDDARFFRSGQNVRLIGPHGAALMEGETFLPIVKIAWTWDGMLHAAIEMQKEQPDLADIFLKHIGRRIAASGASGHTSTSGGLPPITAPGVTALTATAPIVATPSPITGVGVLSHADSGVSAGAYANATVTVDAKGHITEIAAGSDPSSTLFFDLLTNGDPDAPELIFVGSEVVWVPV